METDPVDAQQPVPRFDRPFPAEEDNSSQYGQNLQGDKRSGGRRGAVPVGRPARPDGCYDDGAGLVPVLLGSTCVSHHAFVFIFGTNKQTNRAPLTSDDEAEAVSFFMQRHLHVLEDDP